MKICAALLLLCLGLVWARPDPKLKIKVEEIEVVEDPEITQGYFEGDIELPKRRNAIRGKDKVWPNGIVYYNISAYFLNFTRNQILDAMREMESNTKYQSNYCIRFVERTNQKDYIYIGNTAGCHSHVGKQGGRQVVSLGQGCREKGTIMHELLHALGFWHEQNRFDRDKYVTVHTNNIGPADLHDFNKQSARTLQTLGTSYDFGSLMHYGPYNFGLDKSEPTLSPKPGYAVGVTMGQRLAMSTNDVLRVQKLYKCHEDTSHITVPSAANHIVNCKFETDLCGLIQDSKDDFDWTRQTGATPTDHTGPKADHTNGAGSYIYAEANDHHQQTARLLTREVPAGDYCMDFWLFQYGLQESSLQIRVAGPLLGNQPVQTESGNGTNAWKNFKTHIDVPAAFRIILQANIGDGDQADIAIDDFIFYRGSCL